MPVGLKIPGSLGEGIFALPVHEFMEGSGWSESGTWNIATAVCRAARKKNYYVFDLQLILEQCLQGCYMLVYYRKLLKKSFISRGFFLIF